MCAEDTTGLKPDTEAAELPMVIGRGAMRTGRSVTGRKRGQYARENAGISSESEARNLTVENLRFPGEGSSALGKSGPKPRAIAVGDGQQVEIPVPPYDVKEAMTRKDTLSRLMVEPAQAQRLAVS